MGDAHNGSDKQEPWYRDAETLQEALRSSTKDQPALRLDGYNDFVEIRRGAQGTVYSAIQSETGDRVAVKVVHANIPETSHRRFMREIELVSQLRHPNIVHIIDRAETADGRPCFVMPFVSGVPLHEVGTSDGIEPVESTGVDSKLMLVERLRLFTKICETVSHAHRNGIIHRDLKPSNIRVDAAGEPHILDFGLARIESSEEDGPELTMTRQFVGTLAYAAPEQAAGDSRTIDTRADVYALGVILYEMIDGGRPYDTGGTFSNALNAIENADPRRLVRPDRRFVDRAIEAIVFKALEKNPDDRYQSVDALTADINRYLRGDVIEAQPASAWTHLRKLVGRYKLASALTLAVAILTLAIAVISTVALTIINDQRKEAQAAGVLADEQTKIAQAEARKVAKLAEFYESMFMSVRPDQAGKDLRVIDILDSTAARLDEELHDSPELQGSLLAKLGHTYVLLGEYDKSIGHLEEAIVRQTAADVDELEIVQTRIELANALSRLGRVEDAETMMQDALRVLEAHPDPPPLLKANVVSTLGAAAISRSDYIAAEPYLDEGLRLKRLADPDDPLEMAVVLNNLGMVKESLDKFDEANLLYHEGLELMAGDGREQRYAQQYLLHNLANLANKQGNFEEAEQLFRDSLEISTEMLGPRHPGVAATHETLGSALMELGRYEEAEKSLQESLSIREEQLPAGHPLIASTLATLAELRVTQERYEEGIELLQRARDMRAASLGEDHWLVGKADGNIGTALSKLGRYEEAHELSVKCYHTICANADHETALQIGSVEQLCELYERWPTPSSDVPAILEMLIENHAETADPDVVTRLRACLDDVREKLDGAQSG